MQIIRTIFWIILTAVLVAFIAMNWTRVPVNIWPLEAGNYLHFEWPVGVIALIFFLLGALPMWLIHRAGAWRLKRRIHSLESTVLAASTHAPAATTTVAEHEITPAPVLAPIPGAVVDTGVDSGTVSRTSPDADVRPAGSNPTI